MQAQQAWTLGKMDVSHQSQDSPVDLDADTLELKAGIILDQLHYSLNFFKLVQGFFEHMTPTPPGHKDEEAWPYTCGLNCCSWPYSSC